MASKINALHALYSLQKVAQLVESYERSAHIKYTHVGAARPDTSFLSPLPLSEVALPRMRGVRIPNTHQWAGINDRFAWGEARAMLDVYMRQYAQIAQRGWRNATSTEHFLCLHLAEAHVALGVSRVCVVRTRAGGQLKLDDQSPKWVGTPYPNYRDCLRTTIDEPKVKRAILDRPGDSVPPCPTNPVTASSECAGGDCTGGLTTLGRGRRGWSLRVPHFRTSALLAARACTSASRPRDARRRHLRRGSSRCALLTPRHKTPRAPPSILWTLPRKLL